MRILLGGDVCPLGRNEKFFLNPISMPSLREFYEGADIAVINLECPLITQPSPILKGGPVLGASVEAVIGLQKLGVDIVGLANNHIMDHGQEGLNSTLNALRNAGIGTVGAGENINHAKQPFITTVGETKLAILAFGEREYSPASTDRAGACPIDTSLVVRAIQSIPKDTVSVVLVHGGNEHYPYPSPWLQDTCRLMVELGANIVVCQHSHCIGSYEVYQNSLIVYGQGNLIFDLPSKHLDWWEGLLIGAEFEGGKLVKYEFIPVIQDPDKNVLRKATSAEHAAILNAFEKRSEVLKDPRKIETEWQRFCYSKRRNYQTLLFGFSRILHLLNRFTGFADLVPKRGQMNIGNALRCASHLEVLKTIYSLEKTTEGSEHEK